MRTIIWNFAFEKNTDKQGGNWSVKSIHPAFGKITRYWNVNFQQVHASRGASVPMWQSGKNIYASAKYKWVNPDQMILALVHEIGHWLVNGGGHIKQPGHVMSEVLGDPYINFSKDDMRWFGGLPWKSNVRPWDAEELNFFRPMRGQALDTPESDVIMNCKNFSIFDLFRGKK
jgi:hypothetical protein